MKKLLAFILSLVCVFAVAFTVACKEDSGDETGGANNGQTGGDTNGNEEDETPGTPNGDEDANHECNYATTWSYDRTSHYHASTCAQHPDNKQDVESHNFATLEGACTVCGMPAPSKFMVGDKLPDFTVETFNSSYTDGTFSTADARGKILVINFWYISCGVCIDEMPDIEALNKTYEDDIVVLALHKDNSERSGAQAFINSKGWSSHKTIFGKELDGDLLYKKCVTNFNDYPVTIVLDQNGVIIKIQHGNIISFDMETAKSTNLLTPVIDAALGR